MKNFVPILAIAFILFLMFMAIDRFGNQGTSVPATVVDRNYNPPSTSYISDGNGGMRPTYHAASWSVEVAFNDNTYWVSVPESTYQFATPGTNVTAVCKTGRITRKTYVTDVYQER